MGLDFVEARESNEILTPIVAPSSGSSPNQLPNSMMWVGSLGCCR